MKVTKSMFQAAYVAHCNDQGYSFDPYDLEMAWRHYRDGEQWARDQVKSYVEQQKEEEFVII